VQIRWLDIRGRLVDIAPNYKPAGRLSLNALRFFPVTAIPFYFYLLFSKQASCESPLFFFRAPKLITSILVIFNFGLPPLVAAGLYLKNPKAEGIRPDTVIYWTGSPTQYYISTTFAQAGYVIRENARLETELIVNPGTSPRFDAFENVSAYSVTGILTMEAVAIKARMQQRTLSKADPRDFLFLILEDTVNLIHIWEKRKPALIRLSPAAILSSSTVMEAALVAIADHIQESIVRERLFDVTDMLLSQIEALMGVSEPRIVIVKDKLNSTRSRQALEYAKSSWLLEKINTPGRRLMSTLQATDQSPAIPNLPAPSHQ
jgi:hypothetical protein